VRCQVARWRVPSRPPPSKPRPADGDGPRRACCQCRRNHVSGLVPALRLVTTGPSGSTFCAPENGLCSLTGTQTVAFGAGSSFAGKSLTAGTPRTDAVLGDPDYGVVRGCFLVP
jgi:hypothetical protein